MKLIIGRNPLVTRVEGTTVVIGETCMSQCIINRYPIYDVKIPEDYAVGMFYSFEVKDIGMVHIETPNVKI